MINDLFKSQTDIVYCIHKDDGIQYKKVLFMKMAFECFMLQFFFFFLCVCVCVCVNLVMILVVSVPPWKLGCNMLKRLFVLLLRCLRVMLYFITVI